MRPAPARNGPEMPAGSGFRRGCALLDCGSRRRTPLPDPRQRAYPDRPLVGVGAVIVANDRVVIVRRAAAPLLGEWNIPGGLLEVGETLRQGTAREALEETGLVVAV